MGEAGEGDLEEAFGELDEEAIATTPSEAGSEGVQTICTKDT